MSKVILKESQKELIERLGVQNEKLGLQPVPARIISLLMVSDKIELTFDEIQESLNISKSATSNGLNILLAMDRIEYTTKPGERKRYFQNKINNWKNNFSSKFMDFAAMQTLMKEVLEQRPESTPKFNENLAEFIEFFDFLGKEIPLLLEKWNAVKNK